MKHQFKVKKNVLASAEHRLFNSERTPKCIVEFMMNLAEYVKAFENFIEFVRDVIRELLSSGDLPFSHNEHTKPDTAQAYTKDHFPKSESGMYQLLDFLKISKCDLSWQVSDIVCFMATDFFLMRPCIEHYMLAVIIGRGGGPEELGATFWGQTELSCYDDSQHGIWGMSYKYHERAIVLNERNLIRVFDVCFDGYCGGNDSEILLWEDTAVQSFKDKMTNVAEQYDGPSIIVMALPPAQAMDTFPNPLVLQTKLVSAAAFNTLVPDRSMPANNIRKYQYFFMQGPTKLFLTEQQNQANIYDKYINYTGLNELPNNGAAGHTAFAGETEKASFSFSGHMASILDGHREEIQGSGHLGANYVGVASVREGRGMMPRGMPTLTHLV